jgi:hypothetical protein
MNQESEAKALLDLCEAEVHLAAQSLAACAGLGKEAVDEIVELCDLVCERWWLRRVADASGPRKGEEAYRQRAMERMQVAAKVSEIAITKSGPISTESLQVVFFAMNARVDALWAVLIELGLVSQDQMHARLDAATQDLYARAVKHGQKILLSTPDGHVRPA